MGATPMSINKSIYQFNINYRTVLLQKLNSDQVPNCLRATRLKLGGDLGKISFSNLSHFFLVSTEREVLVHKIYRRTQNLD